MNNLLVKNLDSLVYRIVFADDVSKNTRWFKKTTAGNRAKIEAITGAFYRQRLFNSCSCSNTRNNVIVSKAVRLCSVCWYGSGSSKLRGEGGGEVIAATNRDDDSESKNSADISLLHNFKERFQLNFKDKSILSKRIINFIISKLLWLNSINSNHRYLYHIQAIH